MKNLAIIQARASSTRLPGKVLMTILDKTLIELQVERVQRSKKIDKVILATSNSPEDNAIENICHKIGIDCYRGSLDNVLERFYKSAEMYNPKNVVRLTGDCPLSDHQVIDDVLNFYEEGQFDYAANCVEPLFPDGLDIEVFTFKSLKEAYENATLPSQLEHVTPYIRDNKRNVIDHYRADFNYSDLRWTVDEIEDFHLVKDIFEELYPQNSDFNFQDVLAYLDRKPHLKMINKKFQRNEGLTKSLNEDNLHLGKQ